MTRIDDLLAAGRCISFEFFPPRTFEAEALLERTLKELEELEPSFVSITYGAGGSTRERTHELVVEILRRGSMTPMAHLTCAGHGRDELVEILERYAAAGVDNVLALRGDPPSDLDASAGELRNARDLVELAREIGSFSIGVAAHPEGHPSSPDLSSDRAHLAEKLRLADFAITQFFFRLDDYLGLVDSLERLGVAKPVVPGIMPVTNLAQVERFAQLSGSALPVALIERLSAAAGDPAAVRRLGVDLATELCAALLDAGAPGLHFYTLNRSTATREIHANLGL